MSQDASEFYVVTLPGLEDLALQEIQDWFPELPATAEHGGVKVEAPLALGLTMNLVLKIPTRILLRVTRFRCRDFPKLYRTFLELPWSRWIDPGCQMTVQSASRLSRLKIKKRIEETCLAAWREAQERKGVVPNAKTVSVYIRVHEDECTVSLDTSGERLHKRGDRKLIGEAPLRETIAAALVQWIGRTANAEATIEVVDPMAGSGTFLLEALTRDQVIERRQFAFEVFTAKVGAPPELHARRPRIERAVGFERDAKTLQAARTNLKSLREAEIIEADFFMAEALPEFSGERWLLANPPYGERLKLPDPPAPFYEKLFAASERVAKPNWACFILPAKVVKGKFLLPRGWRVHAKRPFLNGGIPVVAFLFART